MANASKSVYSEGARKSANVRMVSRDRAVSKMSMTVVVIRVMLIFMLSQLNSKETEQKTVKPENDRVNINVST